MSDRAAATHGNLRTATHADLLMRREPEYLTKQEAADRARVSISTIERAIRRGDLRAGGTPGLVLIRPEWLDAWLEGRRNGRKTA